MSLRAELQASWPELGPDRLDILVFFLEFHGFHSVEDLEGKHA